MKSVLISIQPKWCELIANGKKTIEVRKTQPRLNTPFKVYIYCTNWKDNTYWKNHYKDKLGKVIGEFVCDKIMLDIPRTLYASHKLVVNSCIPPKELIDYVGEGNFLYFWHISNLVIYDKPRDLGEFRKPIECHRGKDRENCVGCWDCEITRPPQSWCYVEKLV